MSEKLVPMPVRFPATVYDRLRREAYEAHVSMSALVVEAVREKFGMTEPEGEDRER